MSISKDEKKLDDKELLKMLDLGLHDEKNKILQSTTLLVLKFLHKNFASNKKKFTNLNIDINYILSKFTKDKKDQVASVITLDLLSEILHVDQNFV